MKGKSIAILLIVLIFAVGLNLTAYYGFRQGVFTVLERETPKINAEDIGLEQVDAEDDTEASASPDASAEPTATPEGEATPPTVTPEASAQPETGDQTETNQGDSPKVSIEQAEDFTIYYRTDYETKPPKQILDEGVAEMQNILAAKGYTDVEVQHNGYGISIKSDSINSKETKDKVVADIGQVSYGYFLGVKNIKQGLDLSGGVSIVYEANGEPTGEQMASAIGLIRERLDYEGYTEAEVAVSGSKRIAVDIPGVDDAEEAIARIGSTAKLIFADEDYNEILTGEHVINARKQASQDNIGQMEVVLEFDQTGKDLFSTATGELAEKGKEENTPKRILIILDDKVISAPTVSQKISQGNASITGNFTPEEAEDLAALIRSGNLPFDLNVISMKNVGAKLGANSLETSLYAGLIGLGLVLLFMLVFYRMSGFVADIALLVFVGLELVALSLFGITLTLPGIAGIILSVGMAVDANVIIFERIKEELGNGRSVRSAISTGFSRALPAIMDGNITTLIAAVVLLIMGTGPIKGFAMTLGLGIILSMFTALVVTKLILTNLVNVGVNNPKLYGVAPKKEA